MNNKYAVRYPVGFKNRSSVLYALKKNSNKQLDYVSARKQIYIPVYCTLVKKEKLFKKLQNKLNNGKNLLIIEVDGPHSESLDYYKKEYNVDDNFIKNDTMLVNKVNINIMLNDTKHPFGHGYCLALVLLNKDVKWNDYNSNNECSDESSDETDNSNIIDM